MLMEVVMREAKWPGAHWKTGKAKGRLVAALCLLRGGVEQIDQ